jgi:hypothetical protein
MFEYYSDPNSGPSREDEQDDDTEEFEYEK